MQDLKQTNIFMQFIFCSEEKIVFLYSNTKGLEHLKQIKDNLFNNLITPHEILTKMVLEIASSFPANPHKDISSPNWVGKKVTIERGEEESFHAKFNPWKEQLAKLLGAENICETHIPSQEVDIYLDKLDKIPNEKRDETLLNCIDKYNFNNHLDKNLSTSNAAHTTHKI